MDPETKITIIGSAILVIWYFIVRFKPDLGIKIFVLFFSVLVITFVYNLMVDLSDGNLEKASSSQTYSTKHRKYR